MNIVKKKRKIHWPMLVIIVAALFLSIFSTEIWGKGGNISKIVHAGFLVGAVCLLPFAIRWRKAQDGTVDYKYPFFIAFGMLIVLGIRLIFFS